MERILHLLGALLFSRREAGSMGIIGGADGPTTIYTTSIRAKRRSFLLEDLAARLIAFFRIDAPIPLVIDRLKLAVGIVLWVVTPLVLVLSAVVFSSNRRCR